MAKQKKYNRTRSGVKRTNYANGGYTAAQINAALTANPNATQAQIDKAMKKYGVSQEDITAAKDPAVQVDDATQQKANKVADARRKRIAPTPAPKPKPAPAAAKTLTPEDRLANLNTLGTIEGWYYDPSVAKWVADGTSPYTGDPNKGPLELGGVKYGFDNSTNKWTTGGGFGGSGTGVTDKIASDTTKPVAADFKADAIDPTALVDDIKPDAKQLDITSGITAEDAIKQLGDFANVKAPDSVSTSVFNTAIGAVTTAVQNGTVEPANYEEALAAELNKTIAAQGAGVAPITLEEIRSLSAPAAAAQMDLTDAGQLKATAADFTINPNSFVPGVTVGQVALAPTPQAEKQQRVALTGTSPVGVEAQILGTISYQAVQGRIIKGTAAQGAAAQMVAQLGNIPDDITAAIVEDSSTVTAQIDSQPTDVQAAVAALPPEALVSAQIENLLGSLDVGEVPTWARPAVEAIEQNLAQRGLNVSTVGRDSLFNAIIQSALPIAQSNAQALQTRAAQNLSNQQQANIQSSQLDMTKRMQNLANQQTAVSQSAQMANSMAELQSQFKQQAVITSAAQEQQMVMQNLQNRQRAAELNFQNQQSTNSQNLGNTQQVELANLEIESRTDLANMTAANQAKLAEFQMAADFLAKNAEFKQQMGLANLSTEQQTRLANLSAQNQAGSENLSAAQQTELAMLNAKMQSNLTAADIAKTLNVAQLNVDQQRAVQNASTVANIDLSKFNAAQQVELANSQFMQTVSLTNFNAKQQAVMQNATSLASMDLATVDQRTKVGIQNAQNFLQLDLANLSNAQQALVLDQQLAQQTLLSNQAATNASLQFNASSEAQTDQFMTNLGAQMEQFNSQQNNAMAQFNATEVNRAAAINAQNQIDVAKFNNQLNVQLDQFNAQIENQRDLWNTQNAQAIEQSNTEWRRQANTIDTAATNASNQAAAQMAYGLTTAELTNTWQQLRDEATYARTAYENEQQRITTLYATALANEAGISATGGSGGMNALIGLINTAFK